jgi:hypothetical protein
MHVNGSGCGPIRKQTEKFSESESPGPSLRKTEKQSTRFVLQSRLLVQNDGDNELLFLLQPYYDMILSSCVRRET